MKPKLENLQIEGNQSIGIRRYTAVSEHELHDLHFHPEYEVSLVIHGSGTRFVGDSIERYNAGDVVFLGPNIPHCWTSDKSSPRNEILTIQIKDSIFEKALNVIPEARTINNLLQKSKRGILLETREALDAQLKMFEIEKYQGLKRLAAFVSLLDTLCDAPNPTYLTGAFASPENWYFSDSRLIDVIEYVKSHISKDIRQTDVAQQIRLTPQSFSRFFKTATGSTFVSFLNEMRITEACGLLANTAMPINEIATACGYTNISYFNRRFIDHKKCTPDRYRKKYRTAISAYAS